MKVLGQALLRYQEEHGHLPPASTRDASGRPLLSWRVAILPQLGLGALYRRFHQDEPWDSPHNLALLEEMPRVFACPSDPKGRSGRTAYVVLVGPNTSANGVGSMFEESRGVDVREATDGASNTILALETQRSVPWTKPEDIAFVPGSRPSGLGSRHPLGFNVVLADGSARLLRFRIRMRSLLALMTRDGGEIFGA